MYSILNLIRSRMISRCPLCLLSARGAGLCTGCLVEFVTYRTAGRCERCGGTGSDYKPDPLQPYCQDCLKNTPAFVRTICAFEYTYPLDMLIHVYKEQGRIGYAEMFGDMLWRAMQLISNEIEPLDCLVPVPASASSLLRRGFNPAGEVARALGRRCGRKVSGDWLVRKVDGAAQKSKTRQERLEGVGELYRCDSPLPPVWIGLVDDVVTTGSTMRACAQALIDAGAKGVVAIAVARTPQIRQNASYVSCHPGST